MTAVARPVLSSAVTTHAIQARVAGGRLELRRHSGQKARQRRLALHADDRIVRPGHARVGHVGRAVREDSLIGRLHVRVRADDERDLAVEMPAHGDLLAGRLGVEIHDDDARPVANGFDLAQDNGERIVDGRHEDTAHHVDDADLAAIAGRAT